MPEDAPRPAQAAIRTALGAIFVSLELSRRTWLIAVGGAGYGVKPRELDLVSMWQRIEGGNNAQPQRLMDGLVGRALFCN